MRLRILSLALLLASALAAQASRNATKAGAKWSPARTADGQPALQGYWTNATFTPLERPPELAGKEFYTEAEAAAFQAERIRKENSQAADDVHYDNVAWQSENYGKGALSLRTSIVFDPPDGRIPPLNASGQKRAAELTQVARRREAAESADSRTLGERCISWGADGPPMLGATYNANLQIVQSRGLVAIYNEMIHRVRIAPLDGSPHLPSNIRQLGGDSRGRWEGETLVVDSTNFTDETNFRGPPATARQDIFSSRNLHVIERFTRTGPDQILYRFTVEDPSTWTRPWSGEMLLRKVRRTDPRVRLPRGQLRLTNILEAARVKESGAK